MIGKSFGKDITRVQWDFKGALHEMELPVSTITAPFPGKELTKEELKELIEFLTEAYKDICND
jgi:hemolysin activation/secretion protein